MGGILAKVIGSVAGRWALGAVVGLVLAGGAWKWHAFKEDLIHKGQQVCVQEINKQTVIDLQNALAEEASAAADLRAKLIVVAAANEDARNRLKASQTNVAELKAERIEQRETDEEYKKWSDTNLPSNVATRVRNAAAGRDPDTD